MCTIFGSKNRDTFIALGTAGVVRGDKAWSYTLIDHNYSIVDQQRFLGKFNPDKVPQFDNVYAVGHCQTPTGTEPSIKNTHPVSKRRSSYDKKPNLFLWHNGILLPEFLGEDFDGLDTKYLLNHIAVGSWGQVYRDQISTIRGSFSCVMLEECKNLYLFRNSNAPMFTNGFMDFCSLKVNDITQPTEAGVQYGLDFPNKKFRPIGTFADADRTYEV